MTTGGPILDSTLVQIVAGSVVVVDALGPAVSVTGASVERSTGMAIVGTIYVEPMTGPAVAVGTGISGAGISVGVLTDTTTLGSEVHCADFVIDGAGIVAGVCVGLATLSVPDCLGF